MHNIKYTVYKEGAHYVSQCLNVDVASFGNTMEEAVKNLAEALELYFEEDHGANFIPIEQAMIGEFTLNA